MTSTNAHFSKANCNMWPVCPVKFLLFLEKGAGRQIFWGGNANLITLLNNSSKQYDFLNSFYRPEHGTVILNLIILWRYKKI